MLRTLTRIPWSLLQIVLVDRMYRRPIPIPDYWRGKYKPYCVTGEPLIIKKQDPPADAVLIDYEVNKSVSIILITTIHARTLYFIIANHTIWLLGMSGRLTYIFYCETTSFLTAFDQPNPGFASPNAVIIVFFLFFYSVLLHITYSQKCMNFNKYSHRTSKNILYSFLSKFLQFNFYK